MTIANINIRNIRTVVIVLLPCLMSAAAAHGTASPRSVAPTAQTVMSSQTAKLGTVHVEGLRELVKTLQQIKIALKRPIESNPRHLDDMVCIIHSGRAGDSIHNRTDAVLECGTEGWFSMQMDAESLAAAQGYYGPNAQWHASVVTLGHPWHTEKVLSFKQLAVFRKLIKKIPPPGKGVVKVVEKPK